MKQEPPASGDPGGRREGNGERLDAGAGRGDGALRLLHGRLLLERVGLMPSPPDGRAYHAFISYSHAADGKLAPALQKGLQQFAKPWYRARALHVFRDDASMSVNSNLWKSIEQSLDGSEFYILLASPQAASSEWVAKEAERWRATKPSANLLVALTDGEVAWDRDAKDFDWQRSNALPKELKGAFEDEPRFVDLRWARNENELSLQHNRFRDAVADLAAPLHDKPKDELASDEVVQQRRAVRLRRGVAATLLALAATAGILALVAHSQAVTSQARALAAEATADLGSNPQHSLPLALSSVDTSTSATGVEALRRALASAPLRLAIDSHAGSGAQAAWNPVADQIAVSGPSGSVVLWNARTGLVERRLPGLAGGGPITQLTYSPNGAWMAAVTGAGAVAVWNVQAGTPISTAVLNARVRAAYNLPGSPQGTPGVSLLGTTVVWSILHPNGLWVYGETIRKLFLFDGSSGALTAYHGPSGADGIGAVVPSPDGSRLFISWLRSLGDIGSEGVIANLTGPGSLVLTPRIDWGEHDACWTGDGRKLVVWDPHEAQDLNLRTWSAQTGRETAVYPAANGTITSVACGSGAAQSWLASGELSGDVLLRSNGTTFALTGHNQRIAAAASSPDGRFLATASDDGTGRVWDTHAGHQLQLLNDGVGITTIQFNHDGGLVLTVDQRGIVRVWDAGVGEPLARLTLPAAGQTYALGFTDAGRLAYGLNVTFSAGAASPQAAAIESAAVVLWNSTTGALVRRVPLPTDIAAAKVPCTRALDPIDFCGMRLPPPAALATDLPVLYKPPALESPSGEPATVLGLGPLVAAAVSPDASEVAHSDSSGVAVEGLDGQLIDQLRLPQRPTGLSFAHGSDRLVVMTASAVYLWTPRSGRPALRLAQASPPIDAELSADDTRLVTANEGGDVGVWSAATGAPVAEFHSTRAFERRISEPDGARSPIPPVPIRVAIDADGSTVAAGTAWWTVFTWTVGERRLLATKLASPPGQQQIGGFTPNGPFQPAQLAFSADGSRLLEVDYPAFGATEAVPPITATVFSAGGSVLHSLSAPGGNGRGAGFAIDPGAALDPSGQSLLAGVVGLAPSPPGGNDAVYELASGQLLLNLQNAVLPPVPGGSSLPAVDYQFAWPSPSEPWAPNGVELLAADAVYGCVACGNLSQLQRAARTRLAWAAPLSAAHDVPPSGSPYG